MSVTAPTQLSFDPVVAQDLIDSLDGRFLWSQRASDLYEYAVKNMVTGFKKEDACSDLGWEPYVFDQTLRRLRRLFGEANVNIVTRPNGQREARTYELTGDIRYAEMFLRSTFKGVASRIETANAVMAGVARGMAEQGIRSGVADRFQTQLQRTVEDARYLETELQMLANDYADAIAAP